MKVGRKKKRKSKIRTVRVPAGVTASELVRALKKDKYFAREDKHGRVVTNAPV
jgi:hypothetical protein